mmetsp:Transcript_94280/g.281347  ORF Transcript_94280/g.281347 Transcript_94280/m.281347 type:complete len:161 (-) Transcript_94280:110-592(-)
MGTACCKTDALTCCKAGANMSKPEDIIVHDAKAASPPEQQHRLEAPENAERPLPVMARTSDAAGSLNSLKEEFTIILEKVKQDDKIGADIARAPEFLVILRVKRGLIAEYNERHPEQEVRPYDQIVAVNGFSGSSAQILKVISAESVLRLGMLRQPPKER